MILRNLFMIFYDKNSELGFLQSRHFSNNCPYNELERVLKQIEIQEKI